MMTGRMKYALGLLAAFFMGGVTSIIALKLQLPPYHAFANLYHQWVRPTLVKGDPGVPVVPHIRIATEADVVRTREQLLAFFWPDGIPTGVPQVETVIASASSNAAERVDRLTIRMDYGITSVAYRFIPKDWNGHLILYHRGHEGSSPHHDRNIARLVEQGFEVVAFWMPLTGENSQPWIEHPSIGRLRLLTHDHLRFAREGGHPTRFFMEPLVVVLNHLTATEQYRSISMIGLSGGGWTTALASAIDTRIRFSFPVAGSMPLSMRSGGDIGDYEQVSSQLYSIANYFELYVMGASGEGRRQLQILNEFDPCCFSGRAALNYAETIDNIATGRFEVMIDSSHGRHEISRQALIRIVSEILG